MEHFLVVIISQTCTAKLSHSHHPQGWDGDRGKSPKIAVARPFVFGAQVDS